MMRIIYKAQHYILLDLDLVRGPKRQLMVHCLLVPAELFVRHQSPFVHPP